MESVRKIITTGYSIIIIIVVGIAYIWYCEWQEVEVLEVGNQQINEFRKEVNRIHIRLIEFSLLGETVLQWDETDLENYHVQRIALDSILCSFNATYPIERIDSVRGLLEDKERQMHRIVQVLEEQQTINNKIANQVPIIARKSVQEQPKKPKRKGFLGIFGKKKEVQPTATTTMLHSLNRNVISEQKAQSRRLSEQADSLAARNAELNRHLQNLIIQIEEKVQTDLQRREAEIAAMRKKSFMQVGGLMGFVLLLLVISYIIIHRDANSIKRYKRQTTDLIKQLEQFVQQNKELIASRKKAVHTITHELRTPLSAITGYTELLRKECGNGNNVHFLQSIQQSSNRMREMLNTLLDFFRLDNGKEQPKLLPCRISTIMHTLETEFMPIAMNKGLSLTVKNASDAVVLTDKERIIQIGNNLLSNAIKFTEEGGVSLTTNYTNGVLTITVEDTGTGMTENEQQQVFGAFERLSNAAAKDGFGLGLAIVKNIVTMLSGKIRLESEQGKGSRFTVEIPMNTADSVSDEEKDKPESHFERSFSVLVLDDNDILLSMVRDMYAHCGIRCDACDNTGDLMEAIRTRNYDLLITDLKMPEINGYEVLELLRSSDIGNSKTIPVIVATASGSCTEEELLAHGFTACLFKPFDMAELIDVSEKCLLQKTDVEEYPDLSSLLAYGNKTAMLDRLITETEKDMQAMREAFGRLDRKALDEQVHRLRSSWAVIRADGPLWKLHELLHRDEKCSDEELRHSVNGVLRMGTAIIELARKEKKEEVR